MTTSDTAVDQPAQALEQPLGERVCADLATLGGLAMTDPAIADLIATAVSQLTLVIGRNADVTPGKVLTAAHDLGASEPTSARVEGYFVAQQVDLPAGVVRLAVTNLMVPERPQPHPRSLSGAALFAGA